MARLAGAALILLFFAVPAAAAWLVAWFLLHPWDVFKLGEEDKRIARWAFGRSALGFITIVALTYPYHHASGVRVDAEQHVARTLQQGAYAAGGCILLLAVVATHRCRLFARILRPMFRFLLTVVAFEFIVPFLTRWPALNLVLDTRPVALSGQKIAVILTAVAMITFVLASGYYASRYLYGAGELHPLLGPGVTTAAVLLIAVIEIWAGLHPAPGETRLPVPLLLIISVTGVSTTTILAVCEWRLIRQLLAKRGYSIREIPKRGSESATGGSDSGDGAVTTDQWRPFDTGSAASPMVGQPSILPSGPPVVPSSSDGKPRRSLLRGLAIYYAVVIVVCGGPTLIGVVVSRTQTNVPTLAGPGTDVGLGGIGFTTWLMIAITGLLYLIPLPVVVVALIKRQFGP